MAELDKVLSEINKLPKPTNYSSLYLLAQQAFENGFRGMTVNELVVYLSKNLPDELTRSEFIYEEASPSVPLTDPGREASMFVGPGTYTTPGGTLELTENFNIIGWNGEDWVKVLEVPIEVVPPENKIEKWIPEPVPVNQQRERNGIVWKTIQPATEDDVPGESPVWDKAFNYAILDKPGKNLFNKKTLIWGKTISRTTGLISDRENCAITPPIKIQGDDPYVFSGRTPIVSASVIFTEDEGGAPLLPRNQNGANLPNYGVSSDGVPFRAPVNANLCQFNVVYDGGGTPDTLQFEAGSAATPYEPYGNKISKAQIEDFTEYTEKGGSEKTAKQLDDEIQAAVQNINTLDNEVNTLDEKVDGFDVELNGMKHYVDTKTWGTSSIKDGSVTLNKAAQSLLDFINASGGGTIINQPDEHDLTKEDDVLRFKDGAEGFARIRVMDSVEDQIEEIESKALEYGYILIQDQFDFGSTTYDKVTLNIPVGTTVRFVGEGMFRNVQLTGGFKLEAGRKQIFHNVEMTKITFSVDLNLTSDLKRLVIPSTFHRPVYNRDTQDIREIGQAAEVDLFYAKPMSLPSQWREPYTSGGEWYWRAGTSGSPSINFEKNGSGQVYLFPTYRFVFMDKETGAVLSGGYWVDPTTIKVARTLPWNTIETLCDIECGLFYPEWWGCRAEEGFDNTEAMNQCLFALRGMPGGASLLAANGRTYWFSGGIVARNNISVYGVRSRWKLLPNAADHLFVHDPMSRLNSFYLFDMHLDGNKAGQNRPLRTFFIDHPCGEDMDSQVKITPLERLGYSWDLSEFRNVNFTNASDCGIWASIPGDVTFFNCRADNNEKDGIYWHKEHLKLVECVAWGNGRDGMSTSGIHWRLIGGVYAHNTRNNIRVENGSEWQIIAPSLIDCNEHGLYVSGANRFVIEGVRCLTSGRANIFIDSNCLNGHITPCLIYLPNQKDVPGSLQHAYNQSLPVPDTETYRDIHNLSGNNVIISPQMGASMMENIPDSEATTVAGLKDDLNLLLERMRGVKLLG